MRRDLRAIARKGGDWRRICSPHVAWPLVPDIVNEKVLMYTANFEENIRVTNG